MPMTDLRPSFPFRSALPQYYLIKYPHLSCSARHPVCREKRLTKTPLGAPCKALPKTPLESDDINSDYLQTGSSLELKIFRFNAFLSQHHNRPLSLNWSTIIFGADKINVCATGQHLSFISAIPTVVGVIGVEYHVTQTVKHTKIKL